MFGKDKALEEITVNRRKLYDQDVVDACLKLFNEKGFEFEKVFITPWNTTGPLVFCQTIPIISAIIACFGGYAGHQADQTSIADCSISIRGSTCCEMGCCRVSPGWTVTGTLLFPELTS